MYDNPGRRIRLKWVFCTGVRSYHERLAGGAGNGSVGMGTPIYYAIMQRIVPASITAAGISIDNGIANFGAAMAPAVIGFLIAFTGSYLAGLLFLAALGLIGAAGAAVLAFQKY